MKVEKKEVDGVKIVKLTGQIRISTQNEFKDCWIISQGKMKVRRS